jgi:hypothetical protein
MALPPPNTNPIVYNYDINITDGMMGPVKEQDKATIKNQLDTMANDMSRMGMYPTFFNDVKEDLGKNLSSKISRFEHEEFYNIIRNAGVNIPDIRDSLIKHIPKHSVFYTYLKFPWNEESINMLNADYLSSSDLFDLKIDYLTSWLSYTLAPTSVATHDGNRYLKICLKSSNNESTYFYSTPGLGFGVSSNYNLCLSVELNRDANVVDLKYNSENTYDRIGYHSYEYNPNQGGEAKDDDVIFTSSLGKTCFTDKGNIYDINVSTNFGYHNNIDGITTLKQEDMFGRINSEGDFTPKRGPIVNHLKKWYNYVSTRVTNPIERATIMDNFALIFSAMETDTKYNPPGPYGDRTVDETIVGMAEYTFHPLGHNIFTIWDNLIKSNIHRPEQYGRWKQFKDTSSFRNDFNRYEYRIDTQNQEIWILIDETNLSPQGFKDFYNRLDNSFIKKFSDYKLFKKIDLISNNGIVGPDGPRLSRDVLPSYNTTSTDWFKTELSLNIMKSLYNKPHVNFDALKKLIINNDYVPFLIPKNTVSILQPTFTAKNFNTEMAIVKCILAQLSTIAEIKAHGLMENIIYQLKMQDLNYYMMNDGVRIWPWPHSSNPFIIMFDIKSNYFYYSFRNYQRYSSIDNNANSFKSVVHKILDVPEETQLLFMPTTDKITRIDEIVSNTAQSNFCFFIRFNTSTAMAGGRINPNKTILNSKPSVNFTTKSVTNLKVLNKKANKDKSPSVNISNKNSNTKTSYSRAQPDKITPMSENVFKFIIETLEDMNYFPKGKKLELRNNRKIEKTNIKNNNRFNKNRSTNKLKRNNNKNIINKNIIRNTIKKNKNNILNKTNIAV